jgi:hypothetical protein
MTTPPVNRARRIDWARILSNLQAAGMSMQQIADEVEVGKSTLYGYLNPDAPSEPPYWAGHCLLALWCVRCGAKLADAPMTKAVPSVSQMLRSFS